MDAARGRFASANSCFSWGIAWLCGAIIVVTRYVSGNLSFGAVLATLTATMGDAALLLLTTKPQTGVLIMVLGFLVGTISGWLLDATHGRDFLRSGSVIRRTIADANFVTSWVIVAFLIFEVGVYLRGFDLKGLFGDMAIYTPPYCYHYRVSSRVWASNSLNKPLFIWRYADICPDRKCVKQ